MLAMSLLTLLYFRNMQFRVKIDLIVVLGLERYEEQNC